MKYSTYLHLNQYHSVDLQVMALREGEDKRPGRGEIGVFASPAGTRHVQKVEEGRGGKKRNADRRADGRPCFRRAARAELPRGSGEVLRFSRLCYRLPVNICTIFHRRKTFFFSSPGSRGIFLGGVFFFPSVFWKLWKGSVTLSKPWGSRPTSGLKTLRRRNNERPLDLVDPICIGNR